MRNEIGRGALPAWSHAFPGTHLILELWRYADIGSFLLRLGTTDQNRDKRDFRDKS
jgi:hypothetical protein